MSYAKGEVVQVSAPDSFERDKVLAAAKEMVRGAGRDALTFDSVALHAQVDLDIVEYFFDSRSQLLAEAQLANYADLVQAHHLVMTRVEAALAKEDLEGFLSAVEQNLELAWTSGQIGDSWGIVNVLQDIWADAFVQSHFCELLDVQFQGWINIIEGAQRLGWVAPDINAKALVSVFWSSSVGQVITAGSSLLNLTPRENREFIMRIVRPPSHLGAY
jgi:hypothetical protein